MVKKIDIDELCRKTKKGGEQRRVRVDDLDEQLKRVLLVMINAFADRLAVEMPEFSIEKVRTHVRELYETGYLKITLNEKLQGQLDLCDPADAPQLKSPLAVTQQ